ncbi:MAG: hypothetical protein NC080_07395 [Paraprevotella sp.]|nr:hypothetical protein [Paraprevotella sp.]
MSAYSLRDWLLKTIAFALNDDEPNHEFTRYPLDNVLVALNDSMCMIARFRPDLFTEWRVIKLSGGRHQDARGCCANILSVAEQTDAQGNIIKTLGNTRRTNTTAKVRWRKPACVVPKDAPNGYVIDYVMIDQNMNGRFEVVPPVPCDTDVYVRAKCIARPKSYSIDDLDKSFSVSCDVVAALKHFMLAWLLTGDRFVNAAAAGNSSQYHTQMAYNILGIQQKAEEQIESRGKAGD